MIGSVYGVPITTTPCVSSRTQDDQMTALELEGARNNFWDLDTGIFLRPIIAQSNYHQIYISSYCSPASPSPFMIKKYPKLDHFLFVSVYRSLGSDSQLVRLQASIRLPAALSACMIFHPDPADRAGSNQSFRPPFHIRTNTSGSEHHLITGTDIYEQDISFAGSQGPHTSKELPASQSRYSGYPKCLTALNECFTMRGHPATHRRVEQYI